jgi:hypothetical protein
MDSKLNTNLSLHKVQMFEFSGEVSAVTTNSQAFPESSLQSWGRLLQSDEQLPLKNAGAQSIKCQQLTLLSRQFGSSLPPRFKTANDTQATL